MKEARLCPHCQERFLPKPRAPHQQVCSLPDCQRWRRAEYHREKRKSDPVYRETCANAVRNWRAEHPEYMKEYRASHPEQCERNRQAQRQRDGSRRASNLVNNNSVAGSGFRREVYVIRRRPDLVNNNSVTRLSDWADELYLIAPAGTMLVKNNSALPKPASP